ncbi:KdsC family phosphatase [Epilithonimonas tenax]|uniref:KdsC family phosphatase n=1 Tax=Epilithonimonas tenax TaxID=191577 RepID=UPI00041AE1E3|nr:HAD hydrolase family protein [Epilithonimonas tenax]
MSYLPKLKNIKAFVFDVDGVFTDGSVYLLPDKNMSRVMSVLDGYAVVQAIKQGYIIGIITGGNDPMVQNRMEYLGINDYYSKSSHKISDYEDFKVKHGLQDSDILMMGDDIPDIGIMKLAEICACPANAVPEVKAISNYISPVYGGKGAVRDVIEQVMKAQGKWNLDEETKSI